jgi:hypothetical protein
VELFEHCFCALIYEEHRTLSESGTEKANRFEAQQTETRMSQSEIYRVE